MRKILSLVLVILSIFSLFSCKKQENNRAYSGYVMLYSNLEENVLTVIKDGFEQKYPGIILDYFKIRKGREVNLLKNERATDRINGDVLFLNDLTDLEALKEGDFLIPYKSDEISKYSKDFYDKENYYSPASVASIGIAYNKDLKKFPTSYKEFTDEIYKDKISMCDPETSIYFKYFVTELLGNEKYGEKYFNDLLANGISIDKSSFDSVRKVINGDADYSLTFDTVAYENYNTDEKFSFAYPKNDVFSIIMPISLLKNGPNKENAKLLIDFLLSNEGQKTLTYCNLISARKDVENPLKDGYKLKNTMKIDFKYIMENLENSLKTFKSIFD